MLISHQQLVRWILNYSQPGDLRHHPLAFALQKRSPGDGLPRTRAPRLPNRHLPSPSVYCPLGLHGDHAGAVCQLFHQELRQGRSEQQGEEGGKEGGKVGVIGQIGLGRGRGWFCGIG